MAHFARVNSDNIVTYVTPVRNELMTVNGVEIPEMGIAHLYSTIPDSVGDRWIQTSYNNNFRNYFAQEGYTYDEELDIFIPFSPFPSWSFNRETKKWEAPIEQPEGAFIWNENEQSWINVLPIEATDI
jgi:hypothetical protein